MLAISSISLIAIAHYWRIEQPSSLEAVPTVVGYPCVAAACALVLLAVLGFPARFPRTVVYLGKISYGLYVYSSLGMVLADWAVPARIRLRQLMLREVLALAITMFIAAVSYVVFEKPFLRLKKRFELIRSRPV